MSETFPLSADEFPILAAGVIEFDKCPIHHQIFHFGDECSECTAANAFTLKVLTERQKQIQEVRSYSETRKALQSQQEARTGQVQDGMDWRIVLSIAIPLSFLLGILYDAWRIYHR